MKNNLIIFGAGASYGSDSNKSTLPVLACNLYDTLVRNYKDLQNDLVYSLSKDFRDDFEQGILSLYGRAPHFLSIFQRCMAHYFFQFGSSVPINRSNLYFLFAQKIRSKIGSLAVVTLNYERILEICFNEAGIALSCNQSSASNDSLEICFPHGCCHLFCEGIRASSSGVSFSGMSVMTNGPVIPLSNPNDFDQRIRSDAMPPVMSYFEPNKVTTSGANFIISQRNRLAELISGAKQIIIVGIKIRVQDKHIWEHIAKSTARIVYCSGAESITDFKKWSKDNNRSKGDIALNGYFEDQFGEIVNLI